jgi:hypothetical protein
MTCEISLLRCCMYSTQDPMFTMASPVDDNEAIDKRCLQLPSNMVLPQPVVRKRTRRGRKTAAKCNVKDSTTRSKQQSLSVDTDQCCEHVKAEVQLVETPVGDDVKHVTDMAKCENVNELMVREDGTDSCHMVISDNNGASRGLSAIKEHLCDADIKLCTDKLFRAPNADGDEQTSACTSASSKSQHGGWFGKGLVKRRKR